jgi:pimeloyl-ACP methyl ester carboxylesterase
MPIIKAGSININYEIVGEGEPLLLIMGFMAPGAAWIPYLPMLTFDPWMAGPRTYLSTSKILWSPNSFRLNSMVF